MSLEQNINNEQFSDGVATKNDKQITEAAASSATTSISLTSVKDDVLKKQTKDVIIQGATDKIGKHAANVESLAGKSVDLTQDTVSDHRETSASLTPSTPSQTPPQVLSLDIAIQANVVPAVIPENILSPPKSETQTDETNTATSTSSSPASDTQMSPVNNEQLQAQSTTLVTLPQQATLPINGSIPKSGKPLVTALNKKLSNKTTPAMRAPRTRKPKVTLPMYESEISDHKVGIKLCIKKSDTLEATKRDIKNTGTPSTAPKQVRKRVRKTKQQKDSDEGEYEPRKKRQSANICSSSGREKKVSFSAEITQNQNQLQREPIEQSLWGDKLPEEVLFQIFQFIVDKEGCLPTLLRLGRVCSLWRQVSLRPSLWRSMDLTACIKEKYRTEQKLKWFIDNRCSLCTDLNVANWKVRDINCFLSKLANGCPNLIGITLSGWKSFTNDHLAYMIENQPKLGRLDLSSINVEMNASKSAVGLQSLSNALQSMGSRLTHLYLAHNRLAGIPQLVNVLATHCPNLTLLDLSNVTTQATSHGILHIEKLQRGCQKLKVLRVTNSHITPSTATMQEMMDSPGFPNLEELSVAALTDEARIISDDHLQRILKSSSKLKLLDVRNCLRLTHESLIRLPAWDIKHLFLSGCSVTRDGSGLELIASKWAHSLIELDLAWANVQQPLDNALRALAEKDSESPLAHLNLCGSSVSEDAVKEILTKCTQMSSINLASCRGLPRGVKRLMQGPQEINELREVLKVQMKVKDTDDRGGGDESGGRNLKKNLNDI